MTYRTTKNITDKNKTMFGPKKLQLKIKAASQQITTTNLKYQSPKFKRVSLNETSKFPFWGLNHRE